MGIRYAVLGAGRQGTAAAYDLARNGDADSVVIADLDSATAEKAATRINRMLDQSVAEARSLDVKIRKDTVSFLKDVDAFVSAVPYRLNLQIAQCAVEAKACMTDLGGNTAIVFQELELDEAARQSGICIVPDCGMVPGLGTSLCVYAMSLVETPQDVYLWDGGLPVHPREPWNYILTFHFEGLINEYSGTTEFLRDGKLIEMGCFDEYELVSFPDPVGELEAFSSAGGTSTAPRTFSGKLRTYQNMTLRYKGHYEQWKALRDAGLFREEPVSVGGASLRPRDLLEKVLNPQLQPQPGEADVCILRSRCTGESGGKPADVMVDLFDYRDPATGFTAMERTTGFHASIMAIAAAHGRVPKGAVPVESALSGSYVMEECKKRGMKISTEILSK